LAVCAASSSIDRCSLMVLAGRPAGRTQQGCTEEVN
jgi:hypothetical protein